MSNQGETTSGDEVTNTPFKIWDHESDRVQKGVDDLKSDLKGWASTNGVTRRGAVDGMKGHVENMERVIMEAVEALRPKKPEEGGWDIEGMTTSHNELARLTKLTKDRYGENMDIDQLINLSGEKDVELEHLKQYWAEVRTRLTEGDEELDRNDVLDKLKERIKREQDLDKLMREALRMCGMDNVAQLGEEWMRMKEELRKIDGVVNEWKEKGEEEKEEGRDNLLQEILEKQRRIIQAQKEQISDLNLRIVENHGILREKDEKILSLEGQVGALEERETVERSALQLTLDDVKAERTEMEEGKQEIVEIVKEQPSLTEQLQRLEELRDSIRQSSASSGFPAESREIEEVERRTRRSETEEREGGRERGKGRPRLPPMKSYSGVKEEFDDFRIAFEIRFGDEDRKIAVAMLREVLTGRALEEYRNIPEKVKGESVKACLNYLESKLSEENPFYALEVEKKLRGQTVGGRTVAKVCEEMDKWIDRLHKEQEKRNEIKIRQLLMLYRTSDEYLRMLEMFEKGESYESMKEHLVRVEFINKQRREWSKTDSRGNGGGRMGGRVSDSNGGGNGVMKCFTCDKLGHKSTECPEQRKTQSTCYNCKKSGHRAYECTAPQRCHNCQKEGHRASDCRAPKAGESGKTFQNNGSRSSASQDVRGSGQQFSYHAKPFVPGSKKLNRVRVGEKGEEGLIQESSREELFMKRIDPIHGMIGGVMLEAIMDTGAEVSLISMERVERMKDVQLEEYHTNGVKSATGEAIPIVARCVLEVNLSIGRRARVGFFVSRDRVGGEDDQVLLGGAALQAIGIGLVELPKKEEDEVMEEKGKKARVKKELVLGPGETGSVLVMTGGTSNTGVKVLWSEREEVVDGIISVEQGVKNVYVPVINMTDKEVLFREREVIGEWMDMREQKGEGVVNNVRFSWEDGQRAENRKESHWETIKETLVRNREGSLPEEIEGVLKEYENVFAMDEATIGELKGVECKIDVGDSTPIREKPRPVPFVIREQLRVLLEKMRAQGVIEKSDSPWSSPIVIVRKKDGSIRLCIDYRRLNQVIRLDAYPMPHIESTLQSLDGKKLFTSIDLANGFWQLRLKDESKQVTAFSVLGEHYQFNRLPFGMANSPSLFQREMVNLFRDELSKEGRRRQVSLYIDDLLLATETMEEHVELVRKVLGRLRDAGLLVSHKKCVFAVKKVAYLGHVVSSEGIEVEGGKVEAIRLYARPKNVSELRSFVGMASYYRRFIRAFALIAQPLTVMMSLKGEWKWSAEAERAFEKIKLSMCIAPILAQPDFTRALDGTRPLIITTDASIKGVGGVLSQETDDGEKPLAFHSRSLKLSEKNYSIVDLEALAVADCVRKWSHIVYGLRVIVRTDHSPLVTMFKRKNVSGRILRWASELAKYNIEFRHVKGKENVVADALSRHPIEGEKDYECPGEDLVVNLVTTRSRTTDHRDVVERERKRKGEEDKKREIVEEWKREQLGDSWAREMVERIEKGGVNEKEEYQIPYSDKKILISDCLLIEGLLNVIGEDHVPRLYVPEGVRMKLVKDVHENPLVGHVGAKRLGDMMRKEVYWGSMLRDIPKWIQKCEKCALVNAQRSYIPMLQPRVVTRPMEVVGVDLIVMERGIRGGKYILTVIDLFTKYAGAYVVNEKKADVVARMFVDRWVLEGGRVPESLLSDNGGEFLNQVMEEVEKIWQIERKKTLPYHSRANGVTERMNRTILESLRKIVTDVSEWEEALPFVLYSYNNSPHSVTGETPNFLMYGRDERLPMGTVPTGRKEGKVDYREIDMNDYKNKLVLMMERTVKEVGVRLEEERKKMSKRYDTKYRFNKQREPLIGDRVYVRRETETNKLAIPWEGPYRIVERSSTTATLVDLKCMDNKKRVVQLDRLRVVNGDSEGEEEGISVKDCWRVERIKWEECPGGMTTESHSRPVISATDILHPDGDCEECGIVEASQLVAGLTGDLRTVPVSTLREAGRVRDMENEKRGEEWGKTEIARRLKEKREVSMEGLMSAYNGGCEHRIERSDRLVEGFELEGENGDVSRAISAFYVSVEPVAKSVPALVIQNVGGRSSTLPGRFASWDTLQVQRSEKASVKIGEWTREGQMEGRREVVVFIRNETPNEEVKGIVEAVKATLEECKGLTVVIAPELLCKRPSQLELEMWERLQSLLMEIQLEEGRETQERLVLGTKLRWAIHGIPVSVVPMTRDFDKSELEAVMEGVLGGKKWRVDKEEGGEPREKRPRMEEDRVRRDDRGARSNECYRCHGVGHYARDCSNSELTGGMEKGAEWRGTRGGVERGTGGRGARGGMERGVGLRGTRGGWNGRPMGMGVGRGTGGRGAFHRPRGGA